jgi:hypothetical protein
MYLILGTDQKEYGPVSAEQVLAWIAENRANASTFVRSEDGAEWKPLSAFPEFASALKNAPALPLPSGSGAEDWSPTACISRGWNVFKENLGLCLAVTLIYVLIQVVINAMVKISHIGLLASLGSLLVIPAVLAGLYSVFIKLNRGQPASVSDMMAGFSERYIHLILYQLVILAVTLPAMFLMVGGTALGIIMGKQGTPNFAAMMPGLVLILIISVAVGLFLCFTIPLIMDQRLNFWEAIKTSVRMVVGNLGKMLLLMLLCILVLLCGFAVCCVGIFAAIPVIMLAQMVAYDSMVRKFVPANYQS